ncbi:MAG TPA: hypothetical protein VGU71_04065 [Candidatus Dormibacteraeota bacterium]|nr:hypothetical protein [Candidatus Dormibacteraeota bacterium]
MSPVFATQIAARLIAVVQVVLGVLFWTGHADSLVNVHIAIGRLLVADLWIAVGLGLRAGTPIGLVALALAWSVGMPIFGLVQTNLLPGSAHVVVQVVHLVVGLAAVGLVEALAGASDRRQVSAKT